MSAGLRLRLLLLGCAIAPLPVVVGIMSAACSDESTADPDAGTEDVGGNRPRRDGSANPNGDDDGGMNTNEGGTTTKSVCQVTREYFEGCDLAADLSCGSAKFDQWCKSNDEAINSAAFRRAEARCLTTDNCDGAKRRACEYAHYNTETPTPAQSKLASDYCAMCEPFDQAGCIVRSTTFVAANGIESVGDIFIAAWELNDDRVGEITETCTGKDGGIEFVEGDDAGAPDASASIAACGKTFGSCAADIYLEHLPDCP